VVLSLSTGSAALGSVGFTTVLDRLVPSTARLVPVPAGRDPPSWGATEVTEPGGDLGGVGGPPLRLLGEEGEQEVVESGGEALPQLAGPRRRLGHVHGDQCPHVVGGKNVTSRDQMEKRGA
jgi:hypothetical protein